VRRSQSVSLKADLHAFEQVQQRFQVGRELTAWQVTNSSAFVALSPEEQALLSEIRLAGSAEYRH